MKKITDKHRLKFLELFENFNEKSIPVVIKKVSNIIRNDIKINGNNNFNKNYSIEFFELTINVNYKEGLKQPYYSNVNIYDIINGLEPILISINVVDSNIDLSYLMSIISHEIRHVYDILTIAQDVEIDEFKKSIEEAFNFAGKIL